MDVIPCLSFLPKELVRDLLVLFLVLLPSQQSLNKRVTSGFMLFRKYFKKALVVSFICNAIDRNFFEKYRYFSIQCLSLAQCLVLNDWCFKNDDDLKFLGEFPHLEMLFLDDYYFCDNALRTLLSETGNTGKRFHNLKYLSLKRSQMTAEHLNKILKLPKLDHLAFSIGIPNPHRRAFDRFDSCCYSRAMPELHEQKQQIVKVLKENGFTRSFIQTIVTRSTGLMAIYLSDVMHSAKIVPGIISTSWFENRLSPLCAPWGRKPPPTNDKGREIFNHYLFEQNATSCTHYLNFYVQRADKPSSELLSDLSKLPFISRILSVDLPISCSPSYKVMTIPFRISSQQNS